jgi:hypothetical protein
MALKVYAGRYTAHTTEPFIVFVVGMRLNRLREFPKWVMAARAFTSMLKELQRTPDKGFLGGLNIAYRGGAGQIQYWRSFEDLDRFARAPADLHIPAWRRYNKLVGNSGKFGVWHETYLIEPGKYEAIYANSPAIGLGTVLDLVPATGSRETAFRRLGGQDEPAVQSPPQPTR